MSPDELVDLAPALSRMLLQSGRMVLLVMDASGNVLQASSAARRFFQADAAPGFEPRAGLTTSVVQRIKSLAEGDLFEDTLLSRATGSGPETLSFSVLRSGEQRILFGFTHGSTDEIVKNLTISHSEVLNMFRDIARQKAELERAQSRVRVLRGLLPICANCKKIRNDEGYWGQLEEYISEHSEADFSHGICPECMKSLYSDDM
jgi:hypothetical protein